MARQTRRPLYGRTNTHMVIFSKECLDRLRSKIDLVEALSPYIEFKRAGAAFKALCPFHEEKSPSFMINKGDTHYHCFGCGAHGDAISFLMSHQRLTFSDSVELLAEKFQVPLETVEAEEEKGPSKKEMRRALEIATEVYHTLLLHTPEGHEALRYLNKRGLDLDFIRRFGIGFASAKQDILKKVLQAKNVSQEIAEACGLLKNGREFFSERIMFPIRAASGYVIGYSGRKFREDTFGGKYVNTPETPLFKKSKVLFGLNYSRQRIAKERIALVVEGQIDALRLIDAGLDFTVAGQGTAFGEGHVQELLHLGVLTVYLALDPDNAGQNAAMKIGALFQKAGVEAKVVKLPAGMDPDLYLKEWGAEAFLELLKGSEDYLNFLVHMHSEEFDLNSPAAKNSLATQLSQQIRGWDKPLMVHESLKKLASILHVPESLVGVGQLDVTPLYYKKNAIAGLHDVDPDWVVETDVLRWLMQPQEEIAVLATKHLSVNSFKIPICKKAFQHYRDNASVDLIDLCQLEEGEGQKLVEELTKRRLLREKEEKQFREVLQKILDRNWLEKREEIRQKIQSGAHSDEEAMELAKQFEEVKRCKPSVL